jgi:SfnB family sulfur acquisition oxidoreductase
MSPVASLDAGEVHVIDSDAEAIEVASEYAASIKSGAIERDRDWRLPYEELEQLGRTGLLALRVPREYGGPGVSNETVAEIFRIISAADPSIGQIPQNHTQFVDSIVRFGDQAQKRFFMAEFLRGARLGNALSERGTKTPVDFKTRLTTDLKGGFRLNGRKYYSTGALTAQWIPVFALDDSDSVVIAYVPRDAPGVEVQQDWSAFGQRATFSGTTILTDVRVPEAHVLRRVLDPEQSNTHGAFGQLIHGAVDVGIARNALEDGIEFIRTRTRPWFESGLERVTDEQYVQYRIGKLATQLYAAEALLRRAGQLLDVADDELTHTTIAEGRLAVAEAKAFGGEASVEISSAIFELAGTAATDSKYDLDRHWRNSRTHTLHDANRFKYVHVGNYLLNDVAPAADNPIL